MTSDADDADDERSQIRFTSRRREHSPDHPDWAVAPHEPKEEGRERKGQRGRGRERQAPRECETHAMRSGGKPRARRGRGRKLSAAASFEQLHAAAASASEAEISPAQVMVEGLLRDMKELTGQPFKADALSKHAASEASTAEEEKANKLMEGKKTGELASACSSTPTPATSKVERQFRPGPFGPGAGVHASQPTSTVRGTTVVCISAYIPKLGSADTRYSMYSRVNKQCNRRLQTHKLC